MKGKSIKYLYRRYFITRAFIPSVILEILLGVFVIYFNWKSVEQNQDLLNTNIVDSVQKEISDNSILLAHLAYVDDVSYTKLLGQYFASDSTNERFLLKNQIDSRYEQSVFSTDYLVGTQAYGEYGKQYGHRHMFDRTQEEIEKLTWYQNALQKKGKITYSIEKIADLYNSNSWTSQDKLFVFSLSPSETGVADMVQMLIIAYKSAIIDKIENDEQWRNGTSIYLYDENNHLVLESDCTYREDANMIARNQNGREKNWFRIIKKSEIGTTGWKVVTVASMYRLSGKYQIALLFMSMSVIIVFLSFYFYSERTLKKIIYPIDILSLKMKKFQETGVFEEVHIKEPEEARIICDTYNNMNIMIQNLLLDNTKKETEKRNQQILALESQINPHFLSNTINSIQFMAKVAKYSAIEKMAASLNRILELNFRSNSSLQSVRESIEILEAYVFIMQIRYANGFDVIYKIDEECMNYKIPKLILQTFVENSITHGFNDMDRAGLIKVTVVDNVSDIRICIWDNGKGMEESEIEKVLRKKVENGRKIGIANIVQRLKLYYGEDYTIKISSKLDEYTNIEFLIPKYLGEKKDDSCNDC